MKIRKSVIYVYTNDENKKYVKALSEKYNVPESTVINKMIDSIRTNKKLDLKIKLPKFVEKANAWAKKHLKLETINVS